MSGKQGLLHGPLGNGCIHICVDMQRLFAAGSPWAVPWLERIEPTVVRLCEHAPAHTVFTRFLPPASPEDAGGAWRRYYRKWQDVTLDRIGRQAADLVPALARFVPPAHVVGKQVYSPWLTPALDGLLRKIKAHTLLLTGGETDICVLSTALGARKCWKAGAPDKPPGRHCHPFHRQTGVYPAGSHRDLIHRNIPCPFLLNLRGSRMCIASLFQKRRGLHHEQHHLSGRADRGHRGNPVVLRPAVTRQN